jgi:flavin reductase (DIM6/NTAB) family NADH-FMN oxidoreductase RutF
MKKALENKRVGAPVPVFLVGTYDQQDQPNIMAAAWTGICCGTPFCMYASLRKATYTYHSIKHHQAFTLNVPDVSHVKETDYAGIFSGRDEHKFENLKLTPVKSDLIHAPYVDEFPINIECRLVNSIELGSHTQFVGEVVGIKADERVIDDSGQIDVTRFNPFLYIPSSREYFILGELIGKAFRIGNELKSN